MATGTRRFGVRLFAAFVRFLLPSAFRRSWETEQLAAFADHYDELHRSGSIRTRTRFWLRELRGLGTAAVRERRRAAAGLTPKGPPHRFPTRTANMLHTLMQDLLYSLRVIVRTPVVTLVAVVSLGLGVSANVTIFSVLNTWLLRPLPYPDADRLVTVWSNNLNDPDPTSGVTPADYFDWRERAGSFDAWMAIDFNFVNLTGIERPEQLTVAYTTPNFFDIAATTPVVGRTFLPDEGGPEDAPVVVINETLWQTQLGADPSVLGRTIQLDGTAHTVVGVIPETFDYLSGSVSAWIASTFETRRDDRRIHGLNVTGRLGPGATFTQAQAEMTAIASQLEAEHPETNDDWSVNLETLRATFPGETDRTLIMILMLVVVMALLIACVNIASVLLAKTDARHKELAIRAAMGAGKGRIVRQLLTESIVLSCAGGVLGLVLSIPGIAGVAAAMPDVLPAFFAPRLDATVIGFGLMISVVAGLTFGITPALHAVATDLRSGLVDGTRGGTATKGRRRLRSAFVMAEFAMALTILVGAAALTDLFEGSLSVDPGYDASGLLTFEVTLPEHRYADGDAITRFMEDITPGLDGVPGITRWTAANQLPRTFSLPDNEFTIDGQPVEDGREPRASWLTVTPSYLETLRISLLAGRAFTDGDRRDAPPVVMVNQRFADLYFDGANPIGQRITMRDSSREIVGLMPDVAQSRLSGVMPIEPTVYFPMAQVPVRVVRMLIRTTGNPMDAAPATQAAIWAVDPDQPVNAVRTLDAFIEEQLAGPDMISQILFIVGGLALALAAIGIYGVMAYSISQQTNEIGIRMALGAKPKQVLTQFTGQGAKLAGIGLLFGVPLAALVIRLIVGIPAAIPGVDQSEVATISAGPLLTVSAILTLVGLVACYLPARRATKIDPVSALRE